MSLDILPEPEFEKMGAKKIVALAKRFTMSNRHEIPALWDTYFERSRDVANAVPGAMFGVSYDADMKGSFSYGVGVEVSGDPEELPEGMCIIDLDTATHAVFRHYGPVSDLPDMFDAIFANWLPNSGRKQMPGAVFERYPEDDRNGPEGMAYEIWVPLTE